MSFGDKIMANYAALLTKGAGMKKEGRKETLAESLTREVSTNHDQAPPPQTHIETRAMA